MTTTPLVGIVMGSSSDLDTMRPAADILAEFGVPAELRVVSAHRTPRKMMEYAESAADRVFASSLPERVGQRIFPACSQRSPICRSSVFPFRYVTSMESIRCSRCCRCPPVCPLRRSPLGVRRTPHSSLLASWQSAILSSACSSHRIVNGAKQWPKSKTEPSAAGN